MSDQVMKSGVSSGPTDDEPKATGATFGNSIKPDEVDFEGPSDEDLERRMDRLREFLLRSQSSKQYTNIGMEMGRPKLRPMEQLVPDLTNIFTKPTVDSLLSKRWRPESGAVATAEELIEISAKLQGLGVPQDEIANVIWDISMYCASSSTSEYMDPSGVIEFRSGGSIMRDAVVAVIREHSTLRKVCRAYAPITWNRMILTENPPSNWQAKGFAKNTRYAAWDCFDYIQNPACQQPAEGLIRLPTEDEKIAHATHKQIALDRNARNERFANNSTEITGGKYGCRKSRKWRESKCDD